MYVDSTNCLLERIWNTDKSESSKFSKLLRFETGENYIVSSKCYLNVFLWYGIFKIPIWCTGKFTICYEFLELYILHDFHFYLTSLIFCIETFIYISRFAISSSFLRLKMLLFLMKQSRTTVNTNEICNITLLFKT